MIAKPDQVSHEQMHSTERQNGQCENINDNRNYRFEQSEYRDIRMLQGVFSPEQGALHHHFLVPSNGRDSFIGNRLVAPNETVTVAHQPAEKILIFAAIWKFRGKWWNVGRQNVPTEKDITCARFTP
jgi:hypothetical protein